MRHRGAGMDKRGRSPTQRWRHDAAAHGGELGTHGRVRLGGTSKPYGWQRYVPNGGKGMPATMIAGGRAGPAADGHRRSPTRRRRCRRRTEGARANGGRVCKRGPPGGRRRPPRVGARVPARSMAPDGVFHPAAWPLHQPATMRRGHRQTRARTRSQLQAAAGRKRKGGRCGRAGAARLHPRAAASKAGGGGGRNSNT